MTEVGKKLDGGKLQFGLVPTVSLYEVVRVLMFGAAKYGVDNWKHVPEARRRYFEALQRHAWSWWDGEMRDPEHGFHALASVVCCCLFLIWFDLVATPAYERATLNSVRAERGIPPLPEGEGTST